MFSQYHEKLEQIIRKRKRIESELQGGPSEFVQNLVKNLKFEELEETAPESQGRVFSNDMTDACRTICKVCKAQVTLNYMRNHTKNNHQMTIHEYKDMFGNHRDQIVNEVHHKCGFCQDEILLDADIIHLHVKRHKVSLKEYNAKFITGSKSSPKRKLKSEKKEENPEPEDTVLESMKKEAFDMIDKGGLETIQEIENLFDSL